MAQVLECSLTLHMTSRGVECSILDGVAIFDNIFNGVFSWNFNMSGYGIQWNPWWGWNEKIAEDSPKSIPYGIYQGV